MKASTQSAIVTMGFEGLRLKPYLCPANKPTIGLGSTYYEDGTSVKMTDKAITKEMAHRLYMNTIHIYEKAVDSKIKIVLKQHQYDALVDLAYNLGTVPNTLADLINQNPMNPKIYGTFLLYDKATLDHDGKDNDGDGIIDEKGEKGELLGLVRRRNCEATLYFTGKINFYENLKI